MSWTTYNKSPDASTPASANIAGSAGVTRVCTGLLVTVACSDADQPVTEFTIKDVNGSVLFGGVISATPEEPGSVGIGGLRIPGPVASGLTIAFSQPPAVGATQTVSMCGDDV